MVSLIRRILRRQGPDADCIEVRELSSDYVDGDLGDEAAKRVKSHLDMCGPCKAFMNTMRATVEILRSATRHKAPSSLRERLRDAVQKESGR